jgi:hypothetical protein
VERLTVPPDPVDAVAAALDLGHRCGHGHEREGQADAERELAGLLGALLAGDGARQCVVLAGAGGDRLDGAGDHARRALLVDVRGEPGEGQQERHDGEGRLQGQRPAVGEAVAVPEAHERLHDDPAQTEPPGQVPRVLGVKLVPAHLRRHGDGARGGHGQEGTARSGAPRGPGRTRESGDFELAGVPQQVDHAEHDALGPDDPDLAVGVPREPDEPEQLLDARGVGELELVQVQPHGPVETELHRRERDPQLGVGRHVQLTAHEDPDALVVVAGVDGEAGVRRRGGRVGLHGTRSLEATVVLSGSLFAGNDTSRWRVRQTLGALDSTPDMPDKRMAH